MKIRYVTAAGALLVTAALALTGCSAPGSGSGDGGREPVVMWGSWSGDQVAQLDKQAAAFNASQNKYEVSYVAQEAVEQKLLTAIAGGQVPDLVMWDRFQTSLYAPKGALADLDDRIAKDNVDTAAFYQPALKEMQVDGKQYGIPLLVDNRSLFYNVTELEKAGLKPPTNWNELRDTAVALTERDGGKLTRAGFDLSDPGLFSMWLAQAGGHLVSEDGSKTAFNSPQGLEVLQFWKQLMEDGVWQQGFGDGANPFAEGKLAMRLDGPWALSELDKVKGLDYGIVPPPAGPNGDKGANMGGFGLVIPAASKHQDGAWEFIKWWTTQPKNGVDFGKISGWIPANIEAANDPFFTDDPHYAAFIKTLDFATTRPQVEGYSDVEGKALIPALQEFMSGKLTAEEALKKAQQQGDKILADAR
ncbi:MAG: ABC transporter substrate-binding protein [Microbacterium sp. 69-10]|uniref:ABC transporter substrate-binding protein n=1 Tax=Microbacterium sp. 69-10 TaxID=1895783 RepID=UPI00095ACECE|nr:ABC transporter substrate-binding protein [Microbacterium sp. 69-10]OJU41200.1 MAG: ABC transporter substrate-binding protein [Microbacterium sp. 69-10]